MKCPFCNSEHVELVDMEYDGEGWWSEKHVCRDCGGDFLYWDDTNEWEITTRSGRHIDGGRYLK